MRALALFLSLTALATAQVATFTVEPSKKTTKTADTGGNYFRRISYVDRITLAVSVAGEGPCEVECFFVARDPRSQALSYHGHERQEIELSRTPRILTFESSPAAYSSGKSADSSREDKQGVLPHGWVVIVRFREQETVRRSSEAVLKWVKKNPPARRIYSTP